MYIQIKLRINEKVLKRKQNNEVEISEKDVRVNKDSMMVADCRGLWRKDMWNRRILSLFVLRLKA